MRIILFISSFLFTSAISYSQNADSTTRIKPKIKDIIHLDFPIYCDNEIEAKFPGGMKAWNKFVKRNFKMGTLIKNKVPSGTYTILTTFIITKNGKISTIKINTNSGYGIENEIIRTLKKSPKWKPATNCGKTINTYKTQPFTIIVP